MALLESAAVPPHLLASSSTPAYLRPSFELPAPTDPTPRIVGLLACQRDPLLTELETTVVSCTKLAGSLPGDAAAPKSAKQGTATETSPKRWEVELIDTVIFPEGGGQTSDVGTIVPLHHHPSPPPIQVISAFRRGLAAIHVTSGPLEVGSRVLVKLDAALRHDHMTQHTAQHLLSAVLESPAFGIETLSWGFSPAPSACYVELPRTPTPEELKFVEARCNALIRSGKSVHVEVDRMASGEGLEKREDYIGGVKRTVVIEGVDRNPCCGTHVPSLSYLQALHVLPTTSTIRGTNTRVYFLAGPRVIDGLATSAERLRLIGQELGAGSDLVVERVKGALLQAKEGRNREKKLREELAQLLADQLASALVSQSGSAGDIWAPQGRSDASTGLRVALLCRDAEATNDIDFLALLPSRLREAPRLSGTWLVVLACSSSASPQNGGAILVCGSDDAASHVDNVGKAIRESFGAKVKGGGKGRWQGKLAAPATWTQADREQLERICDSILA